MKRSFIILTMTLGLFISTFVYFSCKKSDNSTTAPSPVIHVKLATSASLGQYLVDKNGVTLYFFSDDYLGRVSCTGGCLGYWPPFYGGVLTKDSIGTGLNIADFDNINVGGSVQTRYKGWPLYYYAPKGDGVVEAAGIISGDGASGVWFVAKPNYSIMLASGQLKGLDGNDYTSSYTVGVGNTVYFTDPYGLTLYTYAKDSFKVNEFTSANFSNNAAWPIYDTTLIVVPSILSASNFTTTTVDGYKQLTYNGWPLYYFGQDNKVRGSNKGVSAGSVGRWPVAVKNIAAAPTPKSGNSGGGGGY